MTSARPHPVAITNDDARRVSGLLQAPKNAHVCYVLAHGAGAGMSTCLSLANWGSAGRFYQIAGIAPLSPLEKVPPSQRLG